MIKTILVPTSGSGTDQTVFATALALGRMLDSHLHFLHVHLQPATAALEVPHMQLAWHGIDAEVDIVAGESHSTTLQLPQAAVQLRADLLVVGGFGRSPRRERVLGGLTRTLLEHAELPVFMLN